MQWVKQTEVGDLPSEVPTKLQLVLQGLKRKGKIQPVKRIKVNPFMLYACLYFLIAVSFYNEF